MPDLMLLKLIVDLGILVSVAYLCVKVVRGAHDVKLTQLADLDSSLRTLMQQAERASSTLGEELLKRQRDIERVLLEIEETEKKVTHAVRSAEDIKKSIESIPNNRMAGVQTRSSPEVAPQSRRPNAETLSDSVEVYTEDVETPTQESFEPIFAKAPEPPSFESRPGIYTAKKQQNRSPLPVSQESRPLNQSIEREVSPPQGAVPGPAIDIQEIYDTAEEALRAGRDLATVATRTRLPIEEVRMLSEMIVRERLDERAATPDVKKDPRLGVLAGMRREVTTL